ncbi:MAG TPA: hypothetical protein VJU84_17840 [Pyrinomonadaceae bacterium]|nr:hypothetical protein [Pyrinomonadaceae bacterium]
MRKQSRKNISTRRARRSSITMTLIAVAILAVGAVTVVSRQSLSNRQQTKATVQNLNKAADQNHTLSSEQLTQRDRDALAGGLKEMINQSTEGLVETRHSDGSVSVNIEDRFQSVTVAKDDNGRLSQSCVDNPQAAGAFFNIDPQLIEKKPRSRVSPATKE